MSTFNHLFLCSSFFIVVQCSNIVFQHFFSVLPLEFCSISSFGLCFSHPSTNQARRAMFLCLLILASYLCLFPFIRQSCYNSLAWQSGLAQGTVAQPPLLPKPGTQGEPTMWAVYTPLLQLSLNCFWWVSRALVPTESTP